MRRHTRPGETFHCLGLGGLEKEARGAFLAGLNAPLNQTRRKKTKSRSGGKNVNCAEVFLQPTEWIQVDRQAVNKTAPGPKKHKWAQVRPAENAGLGKVQPSVQGYSGRKPVSKCSQYKAPDRLPPLRPLGSPGWVLCSPASRTEETAGVQARQGAGRWRSASNLGIAARPGPAEDLAPFFISFL